MLAVQKVDDGPLLVSGASDINDSVLNDTIVQGNSSLHVRGDVRGNLTIEPGANVVVEGAVEGKVINRGGRLVINNREIAAYVTVEGPPEAEAGGVIKIDLTAIAANWAALSGRTEAECAAVVKADAYGCGLAPVTAALALAGCNTFFVSTLADARRVRATAPHAVIYVLNGLYSGTGPLFAKLKARPVINSPIEMAEWDVFVGTSGWTGGCALNVVTGASGLGLSPTEAAALATRAHAPGHGLMLLMSRLDNAEKPDHASNKRQIGVFGDLRRMYAGVPASLANSFGIFAGAKLHYDLVRAGLALYGINPTPGARNPMLPTIELRSRIVQVRDLMPGEALACNPGSTVKGRTRIAYVSVGYANGYPRLSGSSGHAPKVLVGGTLCRVAGRAAMDVLAIDVTDADAAAARPGEMVTLIGGELGIDDLVAGLRSSGGEVLCQLGRHFRRIYSAT